jgi:hypothetical protein
MDTVEQDTTFVVARNGTPDGKLIPLCRRRMVTREKFAASSAYAPLMDVARLRADADAAVDNRAVTAPPANGGTADQRSRPRR